MYFFFVYGFFHLFVRFAHIVVSSSVSFILIDVLFSVKWIYYIGRALNIHLGCFQFGAILNNATMKILIYV